MSTANEAMPPLGTKTSEGPSPSELFDEKKPPTESFCILPWVHVYSTTKGTCQLCCDSVEPTDYATQHGEVVHLYEHDIEDIWNCATVRDFRVKMLKNEKIRDCSFCHSMEADGGVSPRLKFFVKFHAEYRRLKEAGEFERTLTNDGWATFNARYLSVGLSNKCNLSCRMCFANLSSTKARDIFEFREDAANNPETFVPRSFIVDEGPSETEATSFRQKYLEFQKKFDFLDTEKYWEQIEKCAPHLDMIFLHGGEPLLSTKKIDALIDRIVELKREEEVNFWLVTNLTSVNHSFLEKFTRINWKDLNFAFSIDGVGTLQEYIRYPLKWGLFDSNLRRLVEVSQSSAKVHLSTSITVNAYNVCHLTEIFDYIESVQQAKKIEIHFSFLMGPDFLQTDVLPRDVKEAAITKLQDYARRATPRTESMDGKLESYFLEHSLNVIVERLRHEGDDLARRRQEFVEFTRALDKFNGHNILDVCPELAPMFEVMTPQG